MKMDWGSTAYVDLPNSKHISLAIIQKSNYYETGGTDDIQINFKLI